MNVPSSPRSTVQRQTKAALRRALAAMLACATFALSGCVVAPVRLRTHGVGPAGALTRTKFDFAEPGADREQIAERLKPIATGVESQKFFYGHYSRSGWAVVAGVAAGYQAAAGGTRLWHGRNLLVDYDDEGRVTAMRNFGDSALAKELGKRAALMEAPDCAAGENIAISASHLWYPKEEVSLMLRDGDLIVPERRGHPQTERIALRDMRIKTGGTAPGGSPDLTVGVSIIRVRSKKHLDFRTEPKALFELVRFVQGCRGSRQLTTTNDH
jgi:hypothetical protein